MLPWVKPMPVCGSCLEALPSRFDGEGAMVNQIVVIKESRETWTIFLAAKQSRSSASTYKKDLFGGLFFMEKH